MRSTASSRLLAYLQLFRAPNVFTAIADVAMGFVFVAGSFEPAASLLCLVIASCLMYTAGMILNDVYDFEVDLAERPSRPLPSGRISRSHAQLLGYGMLMCGVALASCTSLIETAPSLVPWRSGAVALLIAVSVIAYDGIMKQTPLGPFLMGACRFFNVLLGMSFAATGEVTPLHFDITHLIVAGGIGVYITGVTWFARTEAKESNRLLLALGVVLMSSGVMMLAFFPKFAPVELVQRFHIEPTFVWPMAIFLLTVTILRRCLTTIANPAANQVQAAVKQSILSLVVLDASVALLVADWPYAVGILLLLLPMLLLGKWVYST
ncbi:MAG: UbiA family prenyltransferase [Planctomycetaceae bacterium]|nr:UbiA family prenyltransferase [Planctomycetales bacterium]MCB9924992.1 UbiA family prenyltransferase [Planctomycetaceae bacterium]